MTLPQARQRLQARLAAIQSRLGDWSLPALEDAHRLSGDGAVDASALVDRDLASADRERLLRTRDQIMAALGRLDDGVYGRCIVCDSAIAEARLEVLPEAALCFTCKVEAERITGQRARGVLDEEEGGC